MPNKSDDAIADRYPVQCICIRILCCASYLKEWYTIFGDALIKVVFFDDLKDRPRELMEGLSTWLNIDSDCYEAGKFVAENRGFYFRNKAFHRMACAINSKCEIFFRQYPAVKNC